MTDTDTSAEAVDMTLEILSHVDEYEPLGTDGWAAADLIRALTDELDALRLAVSEARNAALDDVMDHSWLAFHKCDFEVQVVSVTDILALKTPTGDKE